jgi:histidine triad (HIT) family protein
MVISKEDRSNCIFCNILNGKSPVSLVYEDKNIAIFPTVEPTNPGHILIIPKTHASYLSDLDEETAGHIMRMARRVALAIRRSNLRCEGINIFVADGEAAGQDVFHFHLHVYPRYQGDGFGFRFDKSKNFVRMNRLKLDKIAEEIRSHILLDIDSKRSSK